MTFFSTSYRLTQVKPLRQNRGGALKSLTITAHNRIKEI
jgi:hypothetical protein